LKKRNTANFSKRQPKKSASRIKIPLPSAGEGRVRGMIPPSVKGGGGGISPYND
jgi:hypothetical protein